MAALSSDHVNYLIWQYLQEQGYGKAAVQLSRDWQNNDPQTLPFAEHVSHHSLIQMLQDALAYDQLVADARKTQDYTAGDSDGNLPSATSKNLQKRWGFVDVVNRRPIDRMNDLRRASISIPGESKRKRARRDTLESQNAQGGRRKSLKPTADQETPNVGDAMEIEHEPARQDRDVQETEVIQSIPEDAPPPPPLVHTLEIGQSTGVQVEKGYEERLIETIASHAFPDAEIYEVKWDDIQQNKLLVTGGSLCHSITIEEDLTIQDEGTELDESPLVYARLVAHPHPVLHQSSDLAMFSIAQWKNRPGQSQVAAAIEERYRWGEAKGMLKFLHEDTSKNLAEYPNIVLALRWSSKAPRFLTCWHSPTLEGEQSYLIIWNSETGEPVTEYRSSQLMSDAVWTDDDQIICCGDELFCVFRIAADHIEVVQRIDTAHTWEQLRHDPTLGQVVCVSSSEAGVLGLFNNSDGSMHTKRAHEANITNIEWCPREASAQFDIIFSQDKARILVSGCEDGTIKLWKAGSALECLHSFSLGDAMSVWTTAFSPDGTRLAAVTDQQVHIWELEGNMQSQSEWTQPDKIKLLAKWIESQPRKVENQAEEATTNGDSTNHDESENAPTVNDGEIHEEGEEGLNSVHCLAWNNSGSRLALTVGSRISIADVPGRALNEDVEMS